MSGTRVATKVQHLGGIQDGRCRRVNLPEGCPLDGSVRLKIEGVKYSPWKQGATVYLVDESARGLIPQ